MHALPPTRRDALALTAAGVLTACHPSTAPSPPAAANAASGAPPPPSNTATPPTAPAADPPARAAPTGPMPVGFVGHGAPTLALDPIKGAELTAWGARWPTLRGVLVVSAHWEAAPTRLGATETLPLIYDFRGFPKALYAVTYPAPGAPWLADRVETLLGPQSVTRAPGRGLDHGAWVPLKWLLPRANVPVLSVSLPSDDPQALFSMGRRLAPLRDEGVLILGSGNVTHNLRQVSFRGDPPPPAWASEFDAWLTEVVAAGDLDALMTWRQRAPAPQINHPSVEHFSPLLVAAGAAWGGGGRPTVAWPVTGWEYGSLSRRCLQLG